MGWDYTNGNISSHIEICPLSFATLRAHLELPLRLKSDTFGKIIPSYNKFQNA